MSTRTLAIQALLLGSVACGSGDATPLGETSEGRQPPGAQAGTGGSGQAGGPGQYGGSGQAQGGTAGATGGPVVPKAASVVVSTEHTCARLVGGVVKCWGKNDAGQLGLGDRSTRGDEPGEMGAALPAIDLGAGVTALGLAVDDGHSCALLAGGLIKCWGWKFGAYHDLQDGNMIGEEPGEMGDALTAISLGAGVDARALSVSGYRGYALTTQGKVVAWSIDVQSPTIKPAPVPQAPGVSVLAIARDGNALFSDGTFRVAADASNPEPLSMLMPIDLGAGQIATAASGARSYGCAVVNGGRVKCWGDNLYGQLGLGDLVDRFKPEQLGDALPFVKLGTNVTATRVVSCIRRACAIVNEGRVKCWGDNSDGRLGYGDMKPRGGDPNLLGDNLPFVDLGTGVRAVDLVGNSDHICAILSDGRLKCWGDNKDGQLGLGDTIRRGDMPGQMGDALPFVDLGGLLDL